LDQKAVDTVFETFRKFESEDLVYRGDYMVNYCPGCGTTFADLEVDHIERKDPLYYIKYPFADESLDSTYLVVATTRPETIFVDTHLCINPGDPKNTKYLGKKVLNPLTKKEMEIIADDYVDPTFGTGILKLTPAHDKNDFEIGKRHGLRIVSAFGSDGKLNDLCMEFKGIYSSKARKQVVEKLAKEGLIEKIDNNYEHSVSVCYKGGHDIEPLIFPNWFIRVDKEGNSLKKPALDAVVNGEIRIFPKWRQVTYERWMEEMHDWPISRQVVWGIRIPAWYDTAEAPEIHVAFLSKNDGVVNGKIGELLKTYSFDEIESGLQSMVVPQGISYVISKTKPDGSYLQDTDTFDTWFSSGQWPLITLGYPDSQDFKYFYPTSVLETGWEIIRLWVSRMVMFGIKLTGKVPFEDIYLHGLVRALDGKKMSKSLGNVINPDEYQKDYGTDALRMGLVSGTANGKDFAFPRDKVIGYRNFANKIWNMVRFVTMMFADLDESSRAKITEMARGTGMEKISGRDLEVVESLNILIKSTDANLEKYRFSDAAEGIYQFMWHDIADVYINEVRTSDKKVVSLGVLVYVLTACLKLLHPFMPFVTEALWENMPGAVGVLALSEWPRIKKTA
jgi:valyl-tRNA synthetase